MPICAESSYFLQSMEELCEITVDLSQSAFHTKLDIDGLVDDDKNLAIEIEANYRAWRPTVDTAEQLHISMYGVLESERQFSDQVSYIADKIIQAYRATNGEKDPMGGLSDDVSLYIPTVEAMANESHARHFLEREKTQGWLRLLEQQYTDFVEDFNSTTMESFKEFEHERLQRMVDRMEEQIAYTDEIFGSRTPAKIKRKLEKKGQKVLKKGIKTFTNLFGQKDINAFISGDGFVIEGDLYHYRVSKNQNMVNHSTPPFVYHVPYRLQLLTKEGILLADGCILFDNTPIIDHLIAMMLHIKNGNEREILKNTNFSRTSDAYFNEKLLADIREERKQAYAIRRGDNGTLSFRDTSIFQEMEKQTTDMDRYRPTIRPVVENVLVRLLNIPESATRFMIKPEFSYDNLQFWSALQLEERFHKKTLLLPPL